MILKNYYKLASMPIIGNISTSCKIVKIDGSVTSAYRTGFASAAGSYVPTCTRNLYDAQGFDGLNKSIATSYEFNTCVVGNGTVEATINDYCLSGDIITNIASTVKTSCQADEEGLSKTAIWTITNNNSEAITIGEIACVGGYKSSTSSNIQSPSPMLIERTVLENPVTIPAGGVGQVTYTIRMNYPTV